MAMKFWHIDSERDPVHDWTGSLSLSKKPYCSEAIGLQAGKGREKPKKHPLVDGEFFEIHRSKLELDPGGYRGQPPIGCITHGVGCIPKTV